MKSDKFYQVRDNDNNKEAAKKVAESNDLTLSQWVRKLIREAIANNDAADKA